MGADPVLILERIGRSCAAGRALAPEDARWLASALGRWRAGLEIDAAFGLSRTAMSARARRRRDEALVTLFATVEGGSERERAAAVRRLLLRHVTSSRGAISTLYQNEGVLADAAEGGVLSADRIRKIAMGYRSTSDNPRPRAPCEP